MLGFGFYFYTPAVITYWNRLLREVVEFPPLEKVAQKPSANSTEHPAMADPALSSRVG